jgi:hypothetical protein
VSRRPRDRDRDEGREDARGDDRTTASVRPEAPRDTGVAASHPVRRPALQGHVARRHLRSAGIAAT